MKISTKESLLKLQQTIFLLIVFFLPTQLGLHLWPDSALVLGRRIDYLSPTIFFTDLLILFSIIVHVLSEFIVFNNNYRSKESMKSWKIEIIRFVGRQSKWKNIVFFLSAVVGILFSPRPDQGVFTILKLFELSAFALIASRLIKEKGIQNQLVIVFSASMLLQSLLGIWQFVLQGSVGGMFYFLGERTFTTQTPGIALASIDGALFLRPYGTLPHPNVLAGYLLIGILIIVSNIKYQISNIKRICLFASMCFSVITLFLTMSRSSIALGLVLIIGFLLLRLKPQINVNKRKKAGPKVENVPSYLKRLFIKNKIILVLFFTCLIPFLIFPAVISRFSGFRLSDEAYVERKDLLIASLYIFWNHPVLGVGLGNFLAVLPSYISLYKTPLQPVHNIYVLVLAETGVVGFTLVILFIRHIYLKLKALGGSHPELTAVFWVMIFLGIFDHYLLTLQQGRLLLAFIIGLIMAANQSFRTPKREI